LALFSERRCPELRVGEKKVSAGANPRRGHPERRRPGHLAAKEGRFVAQARSPARERTSLGGASQVSSIGAKRATARLGLTCAPTVMRIETQPGHLGGVAVMGIASAAGHLARR
jgi:hypothetical protein